jgi:hypothetical protein
MLLHSFQLLNLLLLEFNIVICLIQMLLYAAGFSFSIYFFTIHFGLSIAVISISLFILASIIF